MKLVVTGDRAGINRILEVMGEEGINVVRGEVIVRVVDWWEGLERVEDLEGVDGGKAVWMGELVDVWESQRAGMEEELREWLRERRAEEQKEVRGKRRVG